MCIISHHAACFVTRQISPGELHGGNNLSSALLLQQAAEAQRRTASFSSHQQQVLQSSSSDPGGDRTRTFQMQREQQDARKNPKKIN